MTVTKTQILLYVPNLIGYARVAFCLLSFYFAYSSPLIAATSYAVSYILDAADGMAARALNQSSNYGAVLDMVTDRCATAIMIGVIGSLYPDYQFWFFAAMMNDIGSHWFQMYSTLIGGETHHKTARSNWVIVRIYYGSKTVLLSMVLGSETFLVSAYVKAFEKALLPYQWMRDVNYYIFVVSLAFFVMKHIINLAQLASAAEKVIEYDLALKNGPDGKEKVKST